MQIFRQFRSRPLQSILTIIAVALGVAVVTAVAAFLDISYQTQTAFTQSLKARTLTLQTTEDDYSAFAGDDALIREVGLLADKAVTLTEEDMNQAKAAAPSVDFAYVTTPTCMVIKGADSATDRIAVSADYLAANAMTLSSGPGFTSSDFSKRRRVAVVSSRLVNLLGLQGDPIGQSVSALDCETYQDFEIVGVLKGQDGFKLPDFIVTFRPDDYNAMDAPKFVVQDVNKVAEARAELESFASKTWGGRVSVHSENLESYRAQQRSSSLLIAILASVGLISAALNIMNLLLARVLKGRRETSILRSLGATRTTIRNRYLSDALLLGSLGGLLGVVLGYGLLFVFNRYVAAASTTQITTSPSLLALLIGLLSAVGISAVFALYPALLASRLNVVDALKEL